MKDFFKNVLATMLGIFLFGCVMSIIGFLCLIGLIATSSTTTKIDKNSVLVLKLDGNMTEQRLSKAKRHLPINHFFSNQFLKLQD